MGNRSLVSLSVWFLEKLKQVISRVISPPLTHTLPQWVCAPFNSVYTDGNWRVLGNAFQSDDRWRDTWWPAYRTPVSCPSSAFSFCFCWRGQTFQPFSLILLKNPQKGIRKQSSDIVIRKGVLLALSVFFFSLFFPEGSVSSDYSVSFLQNWMQHILLWPFIIWNSHVVKQPLCSHLYCLLLYWSIFTIITWKWQAVLH